MTYYATLNADKVINKVVIAKKGDRVTVYKQASSDHQVFVEGKYGEKFSIKKDLITILK